MNGCEGFSVYAGKRGLVPIKIGIGVSIDAVEQIGDRKVSQGLLIAHFVKRRT